MYFAALVGVTEHRVAVFVCTDRGGIQESWISETWGFGKATTDVGTVTVRVGQPCQRGM